MEGAGNSQKRTGKALLIADSKCSGRKMLRELLPWPDYGFQTIAEAATLAAAEEQALSLRPRAAFVSMRLGEHCGCDLVERLCDQGLRTAFCIVADSGEPEDIRRAMRAGARDFLLRPLDAGEVRAFLRRWGQEPADGVVPFPTRLDTDPVLRADCRIFSSLTCKILTLVRNGISRSSCLTLQSVAEELHMNSKYLGRVFLQDTGMRFSDYVIAFRMEWGRELVISTKEKISVIAGMVGYSQPNRFYVHFRSYFGISPGEMRSLAQSPGKLTRALPVAGA